jgi:hypothetical protein
VKADIKLIGRFLKIKNPKLGIWEFDVASSLQESNVAALVLA